jgi:5-methylcytosine-specific restriction endonuclease McrA
MYKGLIISRRGPGNPRWTGGRKPGYYGPNWLAQRRAALGRDRKTCLSCGRNSCRLEVHHVKSFYSFGYEMGKNENYLLANDLQNLVTLCAPCHRKIEAGLMVTPHPY